MSIGEITCEKVDIDPRISQQKLTHWTLKSKPNVLRIHPGYGLHAYGPCAVTEAQVTDHIGLTRILSNP